MAVWLIVEMVGWNRLHYPQGCLHLVFELGDQKISYCLLLPANFFATCELMDAPFLFNFAFCCRWRTV